MATKSLDDDKLGDASGGELTDHLRLAVADRHRDAETAQIPVMPAALLREDSQAFRNSRGREIEAVPPVAVAGGLFERPVAVPAEDDGDRTVDRLREAAHALEAHVGAVVRRRVRPPEHPHGVHGVVSHTNGSDARGEGGLTDIVQPTVERQTGAREVVEL